MVRRIRTPSFWEVNRRCHTSFGVNNAITISYPDEKMSFPTQPSHRGRRRKQQQPLGSLLGGGYQGWRAWEVGGAAATDWRNRTAAEPIQETLQIEQDKKLPGEGDGKRKTGSVLSAKACFTLVFE